MVGSCTHFLHQSCIICFVVSLCRSNENEIYCYICLTHISMRLLISTETDTFSSNPLHYFLTCTLPPTLLCCEKHFVKMHNMIKRQSYCLFYCFVFFWTKAPMKSFIMLFSVSSSYSPLIIVSKQRCI